MLTSTPSEIKPYRETRRLLRSVPREARGVAWVRAYFQSTRTALGVLEALRAVRRQEEAGLGIGRDARKGGGT